MPPASEAETKGSMTVMVRHEKDVGELHRILRPHVDDLSPMQAAVRGEAFFEQRKRPEVATRHGTRVSTYDNHQQAGFRALRASLKGTVETASGIEPPPWYDVIEDSCERYEARQGLRPASKTGKRSTIGGKRANLERERAKLEDERGNLEGERPNVESERGNVTRDGAA